MIRFADLALIAVALVPQPASQDRAPRPNRITILYDAFGDKSGLTKDWGYSALVEYGGKRILFDTGNNAEIFARNCARIKVNLRRLDAAVISHRHGDHTSGLTHLLKVNPKLVIYAPQEAGYFEGSMPKGFLEPQLDLPPELRYFDGKPPWRFATGSPWPAANFQTVTRASEILPGFFVFPTRSEKPGTTEMNELSLAIRTPQGLAVVVGCSHPGVENILREAAKIDGLYAVAGGFHLVMTPRSQVQRVAETLRDELKVQRVAPGHCTSELGFAVFLEVFGGRFDRAGLGSVIPLP
jgi:7,8-dihydropterin-6-yl-methyl-4-(beta-D-ribofuranosyl)aminobenzene 5'-phosphate synthase